MKNESQFLCVVYFCYFLQANCIDKSMVYFLYPRCCNIAPGIDYISSMKFLWMNKFSRDFYMHINYFKFSPSFVQNIPEQGDTGLDFEQFREELGRGSFSVVYKGRNKATDNLVAIKTISNVSPDIKKVINAEIKAVKQLAQHPNIINVLDIKHIGQETKIIMEFCEHNLNSFYKENYSKIDIPLRTSFMKQIASGLAFLHNHNFVHRDMKPYNILVRLPPSCPPEAKICDFGFSVAIDSSKHVLNSKLGTENYKAPELFDRHKKYTNSIDIFSTGLIFLAMCQATQGQDLIPRAEGLPADGPEYDEAIGRVLHTRNYHGLAPVNITIHSPSLPQAEADLRKLINSMTEFKPKKRPNANDVKTNLTKVSRKTLTIFKNKQTNKNLNMLTRPL